MRKEMFESEIARVWREHREAIDAIFMRSHGMTAAVHERLGQLNSAVSRAIGGNVAYYWGPAQYNLATETLLVAYRITSDEIGKSFEATIDYGPDGVLLDGRGFAYQEVDHLLGLLTDKVWEAFQPPVVRQLEIYAPHNP